MRLDPVNAVSSFHYYMWNAWGEEECKITFGGAYKHFWEKWNSLASKSILGAAERFYAELSDNNRELLVNRAVTLYDGKATRQEKENSEILVCVECGSPQVEVKAWVNANTDEYMSDADDDYCGRWCNQCEDNADLCTKEEYIDKMQEWWKDLDFITLESITGLYEADYSSEDGSQSFIDACNDWWNGQDYDTQRNNYGKGGVSDYFLSCCPDITNKYKDYYEKVTTYFNMISAPARNLDYTRFCQLWKATINHSASSSLCYDDTNASRAGIVGVNEKYSGQKVAIIGLGGTGSYLLDYLAKTDVAEIHLYDNDTFDTHNAFRGPGAPSLDQLRSQQLKVDYWSEIYKRMHSGILAHPVRITKDNQSELMDKNMVFICVDNPSVRNSISAYLAENEIPFIDSGMGLECSNNSLNGLVRITTGFYGHYNHLKEAYGDGLADVEDDVYKSNIQIAELNSLAAVLSIIKWKKMLGVYNDYSGGSLNLIYSVASDSITHQKYED